MFWRFGGYANISTLDTILDKPDVTVEELLDESDLIQELKQQNSKLIEFLRDEPVLKKLLKYVAADESLESDAEKDKQKDEAKSKEKEESTGISFFGKGKGRSRSKSVSTKEFDGETEAEKQEAQRKKYAYVACEVLSSEVWSLTEAILDQQDHLREFWQYMHRPAPLDPLQAGYFTKVNEALLDKKTEEMLNFFKSLDGIVPAMLQHVDCPMVMDLLLKIISLEKHEGGAGIVDWLQAQNLIPLLLGYLSPEQSSATQTSAGDFLKAIITISANATTQDQSVIGPNELTRQLVSEECIRTLINDMLRGGNPLTVGVGIIIEVIRKNNSDYDLDNQVGPEPKTSDPIYLGVLLREFAMHVADFKKLIVSPSAKKPEIPSAFGRRIEPLGFDRFKTCELFAELLHCSNMGLLNERGAEDRVRQENAERERLRAQGRYATPKPATSPSQENSHEEFGSSVDSHGFHHAQRPSDDEMDEKPEELRIGDASNADEDGFEKVNAPNDDLPDEVTFDDLNDKPEYTSLSTLSRAEKTESPPLQNQFPANSDVPRPLSPTKSKANMHFDPPPTHSVESPTTATMTDRIDKLDVDDDTVMTEFGEEPQHSDEDDQQSELDRALANAEQVDKPLPLFAKKESSDPIRIEPTPEEAAAEDIDQSIATIQGDQPTNSNGGRQPYETEADGRPVVGDLLKIQFVEHQVVPTILDFFFRFPWNNFLHNVVYDVVQQVFNGTLDRGYNRALAFDLFTPVEAKEGQSVEDLGLASTKEVTDRILDGQKVSDASQQYKGMRLGYMGHLTLIAEEVCKFGNRHPPEALDQAVLDRVHREEWIEYVEGTLAETRDKDNAVLGGVRPQDAMNARPGMGGSGLGGGSFSNNTANTLASAGITPQDSMAMAEGTVGQSFEINSGTMLSGFSADPDEDEEMAEEEEQQRERRERERESGAAAQQLEDDEQASPDSNRDGPSIPPPLNIPPSRARRQLAARLAAKKEAVAAENIADPDAADSVALEVAEQLPQEPEDVELGVATEHAIHETGAGHNSPSSPKQGLNITGLRTVSGLGATASRFSGLFGSSDSSSDSDGDGGGYDEDDAGRDHTLSREGGDFESSDAAAEGMSPAGSADRRRREREERLRQRPSTREAEVRMSLGDDDDEEELAGRFQGLGVKGGEGPFADPEGEGSSEEEDQLVEIRPRRVS
ncbi:sporulation-induced protein [Saxophila tyrrhenica]|uniref:Sporulation-induced protein n=1 Tax=Saxophila tyrrhenica TaxID=1690608 RepID=A0AAV9PKL8_9PEZI|nr:sporulation-induced protein [Saxophila tyrrhenica]